MIKKWNIINKTIHNDNIVETVLKGRGIKDINHFLNPKETDMLPFNSLSNIDEARDIVLEGIRSNKRFGIFYDAADTDGITAGIIAEKVLSKYTDNIQRIYMIGKKHGLVNLDLNIIFDNKVEILIIVDSSSDNIKQQEILFKKGITTIILDHHPTEESSFATLVNCKLDNYKNPELSGSAVTWKFFTYLDKATNNNYTEKYIDLCAVGLLADVCEVGERYLENRYIVKTGLENLKSPALKIAIGNYDFNSTAILFSIAPLINASARTGNNDLVINFLFEEDIRECEKYLSKLKEIKTEQDKIVEKTFNSLDSQIKSVNLEDKKIIVGFVNEEDYTGLIATQIVSKYMRPAIVLCKDQDEKKGYHGSIRGVGNENLKSTIWETGLAWVGGHESAAGIRVKKENYEELVKVLNEKFKNVDFKITQDVDIILEPEEVTLNMINQISEINKITGQGFKQIVVGMQDIIVNSLSLLQGKHIKWNCKQLEFLYWNHPDLFNQLHAGKDSCMVVDVLGTLQINVFCGRKVQQLIVNDIKNIQEKLNFLI